MTWRIRADTTFTSGGASRSHIISFDEICVESPKLELPSTGSFSMNFQETGTFEYGCCIYSRMRGSIEVYDRPVFYNGVTWMPTQMHPSAGQSMGVFDYQAQNSFQ